MQLPHTPAPTVKPWDFETCPVNAKVIRKSDGQKGVLVCAGGQMAFYSDGLRCQVMSFGEVLSDFTNLDKSLCGITEGQE